MHIPPPPSLQDLLSQRQSCKRCLAIIERNLLALQRVLSNSRALKSFDLTLQQKRVADLQSSAQVRVGLGWNTACQCSLSQVLCKRPEHSVENTLPPCWEMFTVWGELFSMSSQGRTPN